MVKIGLVVPVYKNFQGFADLMASVDKAVQPFIVPNWKHNLGVSAGWNFGIEQSIHFGCDITIVANDDVTLHPETIHKLATALWYWEYDLVTATSTRDLSGADRLAFDDHPDFSCFAIKPEEFTANYGRFDEQFTPAYFEDNDMAYRLKIAGANVGRRLDAGMFHQGSVTQNWNGEQVVTGTMFESNRAYYVAKWGGTPGNELYTTPFGGAQ